MAGLTSDGESEGPPSGLRWLRPSGSDPGPRHLYSSLFSLTFSVRQDLNKEITHSFKYNIALLRGVSDLEVELLQVLCATFSARPSECVRIATLAPGYKLQLCNLQIVKCLSCVFGFSMTLVCHQRFSRQLVQPFTHF